MAVGGIHFGQVRALGRVPSSSTVKIRDVAAGSVVVASPSVHGAGTGSIDDVEADLWWPSPTRLSLLMVGGRVVFG